MNPNPNPNTNPNPKHNPNPNPNPNPILKIFYLKRFLKSTGGIPQETRKTRRRRREMKLSL